MPMSASPRRQRQPWTVRVALWSARHRWPVFGLWFVLTIGIFVASLGMGGIRAVAATGYFLTTGGGSTAHLETIRLGIDLANGDGNADGADVQFDWSINGVPFRYSVRRDTNC